MDDTSTGSEAPQRRRKEIPLHTKILTGLVVGAVAGAAGNQLVVRGAMDRSTLEWIVKNLTGPLGQIFLNMLFLVVVPIVVTSLALGVAQLGNVKKLGRLGVKTFGYFFLTMTLSVSLGLVLINIFRPGEGFDRETQASLLETFGGQAEERTQAAEAASLWPDMLVGIVSRNPIRDAADTKMLPIIFVSILFGLALTMVPPEKAAPTLRVLEGIGEAAVVIVGFAMRLAPYAVPALIFGVTALFGWELLGKLSFFVAMVLFAYLIHLFGSFSVLLRVFARYSPARFFKKAIPIMVTALSTSSSAATLPTTMKVCKEDMGVPGEIAGFVLSLGATANMNGTSLFEGLVVLFLAQVFGVELSLGMQLLVVLLAVLAAVGAAGVPGGAIPMMVVVMEAVGVPGEGIALIIGVDRILDMGRTVLNVTGDATAACFVARSEGYELTP